MLYYPWYALSVIYYSSTVRVCNKCSYSKQSVTKNCVHKPSYLVSFLIMHLYTKPCVYLFFLWPNEFVITKLFCSSLLVCNHCLSFLKVQPTNHLGKRFIHLGKPVKNGSNNRLGSSRPSLARKWSSMISSWSLYKNRTCKTFAQEKCNCRNAQLLSLS